MASHGDGDEWRERREFGLGCQESCQERGILQHGYSNLSHLYRFFSSSPLRTLAPSAHWGPLFHCLSSALLLELPDPGSAVHVAKKSASPVLWKLLDWVHFGILSIFWSLRFMLINIYDVVHGIGSFCIPLRYLSVAWSSPQLPRVCVCGCVCLRVCTCTHTGACVYECI